MSQLALTVGHRERGRALDGAPALGFFPPTWFATVMGTGILANAAATLPAGAPALLPAARAVWLLDAVLLVAVAVATGLHWRRHRAVARAHLDDPALAWFHGAPAMALLTVGAGALLVGVPLLGRPVAIGLDAVLWTAGTLLGLSTAVGVPLRAVTRFALAPDAVSGAWLIPVVPPMVSAATGPLLAAHLPPGPPRAALIGACLAMAGLALVASTVVVVLLGRRLWRHGVGPAAGVPTWWIVLGPLGQSVTAAHTLGVGSLDVDYGIPVWILALLCLAACAAVTVRTARTHLPFSLAWWSFTFPVGTVVTGTSGLAAATGAPVFTVVAVLLYVGLVAAWLVVAARTAHGTWTGRLLLPRGRVTDPGIAR